VFVGIDGADNKYLHIIGTVCEGEIEGLAEIDGVPQVYLSDKIYTDYGTSFTYEFFTGSPTQTVCATLQAAIPEWTDPLTQAIEDPDWVPEYEDHIFMGQIFYGYRNTKTGEFKPRGTGIIELGVYK